MSLDWIYYAISWILLRWEALWDAPGLSVRISIFFSRRLRASLEARVE